VAGNIVQLLTASGCVRKFQTFSVFLEIDEATLFKFGKWVDYGRIHRRVKNFSRKGRGLGHVSDHHKKTGLDTS